jgi:hypothetical protein
MNEIYKVVTVSKCSWDNGHKRCIQNIRGEKHHWKTEVAGRIIKRSTVGKKYYDRDKIISSGFGVCVIVTRLRGGKQRKFGLIPGRDKRLSVRTGFVVQT